MHKYAYICTLGVPQAPGGYPPARLSPSMGTESDFESIFGDFRRLPETPLESRGDQFSASTRPGSAKKDGRDTQSSDCAENRVSDGLPEGIAVTPDLHFMVKML